MQASEDTKINVHIMLSRLVWSDQCFCQ